jgi:60 kDa SS-A/Ro ribonucleoprotein
MFKFSKYFSTKTTTQTQAIPGTDQVVNSAGGYVWDLGAWQRLDRFLILGSSGGTYYVSERKLTIDNADAVASLLATDGVKVVERIVAVSSSGRAPKNDSAIFALAMAAKLGDEATRRAAFAAMPNVCRTASHLMQFAEYAQAFGGWGRGMRRAVASWFNDKPAADLAYQLIKYQSRDGWSTRDLLRLAHPRASSPAHDQLFAWVTKGGVEADEVGAVNLPIIDAVASLRSADSLARAAKIVKDAKLPREAVPTQWLAQADMWQALLHDMPMTALLRNVATMTRVGLLTTGSNATKQVVAQLRDVERLRKARVHPLGVLAALNTYRGGRGVRGGGRKRSGAANAAQRDSWKPVAAIVDALDSAFYQSFGAVPSTGKRMMLALDVSGSMSTGEVGGIAGLTPRVASAAMALITAATERDHHFIGFSAAAGGYGGQWGGGTPGITQLAISPRQRLDDVVKIIEKVPMGGTDCALPMIWAQKQRIDVDTFVIYTDNETWAGDVHPAQALREYRQARGIPAKLVVVGMTSTGFSIADPKDAGMLDVVGFDTATPAVIADFSMQR